MAERPNVSPLLSPDDLFSHLKTSLGINLQSVEELLRPRSEVMKQVYVELLSISYGKSPEGMQSRSSLNAIVNVSYPELVEGNFPTTVLFVRLKELMRRLGHMDIQLKDILCPEFKRTRVILSEIVNFLKFRTDEEIVMGDDGRVVNATAFSEEHSRVREELERIQQEVSVLHQKQHDQEPIIAPKQTRIRTLAEEKSHLEESRRELEADTKRFESELASTEEQTRKIYLQAETLSEKLEALESQVTSSPDKVTSALFESQQQHEKEKEVTLVKQEKTMQLAARYQSLQKAQSRLREANLLLQPYHLSLIEKQRLKSAILEKHAQLLELEKDLKRLELSANNYSRELRKLDEQKARNQTSSESKLLLLERQREEKLSEKQRAIKSHAELQERLRQATAVVQEMEYSLGQYDAEHSAHVLEMAEEHERVITAVEKYCTEAATVFRRSDETFKGTGQCHW